MTGAAPAPRARRTQADRTAATRAALAAAATEVLLERGWAAVTVAEVCKRAGVTPGAFHHHHASLPSLLADALRRLCNDLRGNVTEPPTDLVGLIDATWAALGDLRFKAVLEAWVAMANDPGLAAEIGPVVAEIATLLTPEVLAPSIVRSRDARERYLTAREALLGLALGRVIQGGKPLGHERAVLARLRADATEASGGA